MPNRIENSIQVFVVFWIENMENVIVEEICGVCYYFKVHHNEMICPPKHFSCFCELFKTKYICCKNGHSNLMKNVPPYIAIYSPNPEVINSN